MFKIIVLKQSDGSVLGPEQTLNQIKSIAYGIYNVILLQTRMHRCTTLLEICNM